MAKCREYFSCKFWVRRGTQCHLKSSKGKEYSDSSVQYGPRCCDNGSENDSDNDGGSSGGASYSVPPHWNLW